MTSDLFHTLDSLLKKILNKFKTDGDILYMFINLCFVTNRHAFIMISITITRIEQHNNNAVPAHEFEKLSKITGLKPAEHSSTTVWDPMYPAPPVTSTNAIITVVIDV